MTKIKFPKLCVNVDHVATLRQARREGSPNPVEAALLCERYGADGIIVHLREDRRHIQDDDLYILRKKIKTHISLEMAATSEMVEIAKKVKPDLVCLVPERRQELTTEGGLNVFGQKRKLTSVVRQLKEAGISVSVFVDPREAQIRAAHEVGASAIELHTGTYANTKNRYNQFKELAKLKKVGALAVQMGLILNAGHGLNYKNVGLVAQIPHMHSLNIGFSIVARAIFVGLAKAVREMKELLKSH